MDERARALLEGKNFATVSTLRPDGSIHSVFVWVHVEGERVVVNSSPGRAWPRNVERDPRVTLLVADQQDPYSYVQIRGRVAETDVEHAEAHINELSHKYTGGDYSGPMEPRVKFFIEPDQVIVAGG